MSTKQNDVTKWLKLQDKLVSEFEALVAHMHNTSARAYAQEVNAAVERFLSTFVISIEYDKGAAVHAVRTLYGRVVLGNDYSNCSLGQLHSIRVTSWLVQQETPTRVGIFTLANNQRLLRARLDDLEELLKRLITALIMLGASPSLCESWDTDSNTPARVYARTFYTRSVWRMSAPIGHTTYEYMQWLHRTHPKHMEIMHQHAINMNSGAVNAYGMFFTNPKLGALNVPPAEASDSNVTMHAAARKVHEYNHFAPLNAEV